MNQKERSVLIAELQEEVSVNNRLISNDYLLLTDKYPKGTKFKYLGVDMISKYIQKGNSYVDHFQGRVPTISNFDSYMNAHYFNGSEFKILQFYVSDLCLIDKFMEI